jgi:DNA-binding MarR family transcriptional regulator
MRKGQWDMTAKYGKGKILSLLEETPGLTIAEIQDLLGGRSALVGRNVREMIADGYLDRDYILRDGDVINTVRFGYYLTTEGKIQLDTLTR